MAVDKSWLVEVRKSLHQDIADTVKATEHTALRVLREPNISKKQPSPKIIIVVDTDKQAEELKDSVLASVRGTNNVIESQLSESLLERWEIRYKVKIVHATGDIMLSVKPAQYRETLSGEKVKEKLQELKSLLLYNIKETREVIDKCIDGIKPKKSYIYAKSTGSSYRVTFFNDEIRQQVSVGNVLIVVSDTNSQIIDTPPRKQRSDKKDCLYDIPISTNYTIYLYEDD